MQNRVFHIPIAFDIPNHVDVVKIFVPGLAQEYFNSYVLWMSMFLLICVGIFMLNILLLARLHIV